MTHLAIAIKIGATVLNLFLCAAFCVKVAQENGNTYHAKTVGAGNAVVSFVIITAAIWI